MSEKKKKGKQELAKVQEEAIRSLTVEQVMKHPAVQQINKKFEEMQQLVQALPEAIGRAVAEAQRSKKLPIVSGPSVPLNFDNGNVEFYRKGRIVQDGKEVAPEGPTQGDFVKDLEQLGSAGAFGRAIPALPAPTKPPLPGELPGDPPPQA